MAMRLTMETIPHFNKNKPHSQLVPLKVFCCVAPEDQAMLEQLKKHLKPLQRQGQIAIMSSLDTPAGSELEKERRLLLENADVILLLLSPDFMHSDYCSRIEMIQAIKRYDQGAVQVIPVLIRTTYWEDTPIARFQIIPTGAKPVSRWRDQDEAFHDIVGHLKRFLARFLAEQEQKEVIANPTLVETTSASLNLPAFPLSILPARPKAMIQALYTLAGHAGAVSKIALSMDRKILASWSSDRTIKLWDARNGQFLHTLTGSVDNMVLSADGQVLASWSAGHMIQLWDTRTSKLLLTLKDSEHTIQHMASSTDGQILACSGNFRGKYTIKLWNVQASQLLHTFKGDAYGIHHMALSTNGQVLACSGSFHGRQMIKLWDVRSGKLLLILKENKDDIHSLTLSADGQILACSGPDWTIKLWNVRTGKLLHTLTGLAHYITLSANGQILACSGLDQAIKLWNVQTGELLVVLKGHTREVCSMAFSADGWILASGSEDQTIKVWGMK